MEDETAAPVLGHRRGHQWTRISHGLYVPSGGDVRPLQAWQLVLPETAVFTHLTAAAEHELWLPPLPDGLPVFAAQPMTEARSRRAGLRVRRLAAHPESIDVDGVRLATVADTLLACARDLALLDLVVLVDAALSLGKCTREEIAAVADTRRAGAPLLRQALALSDARSESPWESLLRILHETCEVEVQPQPDIFDEFGGFLGRADLWIVGTNALHEYDGGEHLKKPRQRKDLRRGRGLSNAQWVRRGYTDDDVLHHGVAILRDADLSLGRPHEASRVRAWHRLLVESAFTPAGRERLAARLGLPARSAAESGHRLHA